MTDSKDKLFSDFSSVSTQEWLDKIKTDLKGADFEKKLVWRTTEGFKVQPFYRKEDLKNLKTIEGLPDEFPYVRGIKKDDNSWFVRQDIQVNEAAEANKKAHYLLNKGIDSLGFVIKGKEINEDFLNALLKDIHCDCIDLNFTVCQKLCLPLAEALVNYFQRMDYDPNRLVGSINFDPIGKMMKSGKDLSKVLSSGKKLVEKFASYPHFRCINVNAVELNNAGSYIYQELGYALAWGTEYLNLLVEAGVPAALAAGKIKFNFGISSNYFMEIAKFRAARMLWADIVNEYHPTNESGERDDDACKMIIHAETSQFNLTLFDAYVNLLRTQTEAMSAALAGVHSMRVVPFDAAYEEPTEFSERIARNQQLLLKEEAHFNRIVDPGAGSYYIETLTASIAKQAWELFLKIDEEGGMFQSVIEGKVQEAINASNQARHEAVSKRKEVLLGTNQFPNFNEVSAGKTPIDGCCGKKEPHRLEEEEDRPIARLNKARAASQFEALRLQTEKSDKRPMAFMLTIGNLAMRQARAQFSCNFLACAGYKVIDNLGFSTIKEGVDAAMKAKADIVVLCSSDDEYAEYAIPAFQEVGGKALFIVAGAPACMDDLKAAGIENFIHVRCNVLDTLKGLNEKLGIK